MSVRKGLISILRPINLVALVDIYRMDSDGVSWRLLGELHLLLTAIKFPTLSSAGPSVYGGTGETLVHPLPIPTVTFSAGGGHGKY